MEKDSYNAGGQSSKYGNTFDDATVEVVEGNKDESELAAQGKKQVTRRNFGFVTVLGLSLACTVTWEGVLITFVYGLTNGGPAGSIFEFLADWIGFLAITASLAELASMAPTAGGSFHWVYLFAPARCKKFLSYVTGWMQVIAWQATVASASYLAGTMIQGLAILNYPSYAHHSKNWHGTLLVYAVMLVAVIFNAALGRWLPQVEGLILIIHLAAFVGILVPLVYFAPHSSADEVFTTFLAQGGYSSNGVTFFVGTVGASFSLLGSDCPVHLCEEVKNASTVVPIVMVLALAINGALGFGMIIALFFCIGDMNAALKSPTGYPYLEIFAQAVKSVPSATAMASFIVVLALAATISIFAGASRMTWAFARDKGLPGWRWLGHVDTKTKLPLFAMACTTLIVLLLALINIGSSAAFNAFVSLAVSSLLASYLLPIVLLTWMKITRPSTIRYGPWKMGYWGLPINILGICWCVLAMIFSFFPTDRIDLTVKTMNWSSLMFGGTLIIAVALYPLYGKRHFKGPVIETDLVDQIF